MLISSTTSIFIPPHISKHCRPCKAISERLGSGISPLLSHPHILTSPPAMRATSRPLSVLNLPKAPLIQSPWTSPRPVRHSRQPGAFSTTTPAQRDSKFNRSDFGNQPFTGIYEPGCPTAGPLGGTSNVGAPKITPRKLKEHLDDFVIGQDRAKKVLSTAVYNHYQRIEELKRQEDEYEKLVERQARIGIPGRHPVEGITLYPACHGCVAPSMF